MVNKKRTHIEGNSMFGVSASKLRKRNSHYVITADQEYNLCLVDYAILLIFGTFVFSWGMFATYLYFMGG